jgi:hypothetical protein
MAGPVSGSKRCHCCGSTRNVIRAALGFQAEPFQEPGGVGPPRPGDQPGLAEQNVDAGVPGPLLAREAPDLIQISEVGNVPLRAQLRGDRARLARLTMLNARPRKIIFVGPAKMGHLLVCARSFWILLYLVPTCTLSEGR